MNRFKRILLLIFIVPLLTFAKGGGGHGGGGHGGGHSGGGHSYSHSTGHGEGHSSHSNFGETHGGNISHEGYSSYKNISAVGYQSSISGKSYISKTHGAFNVPEKMTYSQNNISYSSPYRYRVNTNINSDLINMNYVKNSYAKLPYKNTNNYSDSFLNNYLTYRLFFGSGNHQVVQNNNLSDNNSLDLSVVNSDFGYVNDGDDGNDNFNAFDLPIQQYSNYIKESYDGDSFKKAIDMAGLNTSLVLLYPDSIYYLNNNKSCNIKFSGGKEITFLSENQIGVLNDNTLNIINNPCLDSQLVKSKFLTNVQHDQIAALIDITNSRTYVESTAVWIARNNINTSTILLYRNSVGLSFNFPTFNKECIFIGNNINNENTALNPTKNCLTNNIYKIAYVNKRIYLNTDSGIYSFKVESNQIPSTKIISEFKNVYPIEYQNHHRDQEVYPELEIQRITKSGLFSRFSTSFIIIIFLFLVLIFIKLK